MWSALNESLGLVSDGSARKRNVWPGNGATQNSFTLRTGWWAPGLCSHQTHKALILHVWWEVPSRGPFRSSLTATFWNVPKNQIKKFPAAPTLSRATRGDCPVQMEALLVV